MKYFVYGLGIIATILFLMLAVNKMDLVLTDGLTVKDTLFFAAVIFSIGALWYQITKNLRKGAKQSIEISK